MFHVLIDTSVWLDLAANQKQTPLLTVLVEFFGEGQLQRRLDRQCEGPQRSGAAGENRLIPGAPPPTAGLRR
jgi:hypothetical protein